jgi:hypothetical protein
VAQIYETVVPSAFGGGKLMEIIIGCKTCGLVQRVDELQPDTAAEAKKEWLEWAPEIRISR